MVRCKAIRDFSLKEFKKLSNIKRKDKAEEGWIYVHDTFECDEDMAKYLLGDNPKREKVVEILEIIPTEAKKKKK